MELLGDLYTFWEVHAAFGRSIRLLGGPYGFWEIYTPFGRSIQFLKDLKLARISILLYNNTPCEQAFRILKQPNMTEKV